MANTAAATPVPAAAPSVASGLVNAGSGLITSVLNNIWEDSRAKKEREWNEKMMDKQNQWSLDMWNRTNEYNAPGAQVQRLEDAGLNPLYYGLDGSSANGLESAQALGYQRASTQGIANPVADFFDAAIKRAQIDNINADTAKKNNETVTETERRQNLIKQRDEMDADIKQKLSVANLNDKLAAKAEQYMEYADDIYQSQIDKDRSTAGLNDQMKERIAALLPGEKELQKMTLHDFVEKWRKWNAEIGHMFAQNALLGKQARYYLVSLLQGGTYGSGASIVNAYIMQLIQEDSDLTPKDKEELERIFSPEKSDERKSDSGLYRDAPEGNPRDPATYE